MKYLVVGLIKLYQKSISKILVNINPHRGCRFYPSCSDYCIQAIGKYGLLKGVFLGGKRILRCNPFSEGGTDIC